MARDDVDEEEDENPDDSNAPVPERDGPWICPDCGEYQRGPHRCWTED